VRTFTQWCSPSWTLDQTTTNTDTYLTTTVYDMIGVVPEPGTGWLLGLGGIALALKARRGRNSKNPGDRE